MNTRLLTAGVLAGLAMFVWGAISHMALPLGEIGIQTLPDEAAVLDVLKDKIRDQGLYLYPGEKDMAKAQELLKVKPRGLITYTPASTPFSLGASLAVQCLDEIIVGLLLAWLLAKAAGSLPGLGAKIGYSLVLFVLATAAYLGPYWNWYGFPILFVLANAGNWMVAAVIGTVVIAKVMRW